MTMIVGAILLACQFGMTLEQCVATAEAFPSIEACEAAAAARHGVLVRCYPVLDRSR